MIIADYVPGIPNRTDGISIHMTVDEANYLMVYVSTHGANEPMVRRLYQELSLAVERQRVAK